MRCSPSATADACCIHMAAHSATAAANRRPRVLRAGDMAFPFPWPLQSRPAARDGELDVGPMAPAAPASGGQAADGVQHTVAGIGLAEVRGATGPFGAAPRFGV